MDIGLEQTTIGGYGDIHPDMVHHITNLIERFDEQYCWNNGKTAVFWHVLAIINQHIESSKT